MFSAFSNILAQSISPTLPKGEGDFSSAYGCAVMHAVQDLRNLGNNNDFSEEDRTASFLGHFSSHLSWYNFFADLSELEKGSTSVQAVSWSYQRKTEEAIRGGDFGIVCALSNHTYNIAFFQAKNGKVGDDFSANFDVKRSSSKINSSKTRRNEIAKKIKALEEEKPVDNKAIQSLEKEDAKLRALIQEAETEKSALFSNNFTSPKDVTKSDQIVKLACTNMKAGLTLDRATWIHYVVWPDRSEGYPMCFDLAKVIEIINRTGATNTLLVKAKGNEGCSFTNLLTKGMTTNAPGWLNVDVSTAETLIGECISLCPSWMIVEEADSSMAKMLLSKFSRDDGVFIKDIPVLEKKGPIAMNSIVAIPGGGR